MTQVENKANFNGKNCQKKLEYLKLSTFYKNIEGQLLSRSSTCYLVFNTLVEITEKVIQFIKIVKWKIYKISESRYDFLVK